MWLTSHQKFYQCILTKLVRKAERRLEKLGNQLVMNSAVSEIQADKVILNKGETVINTRTVIWAAGIEGSDIVDQAQVEKQVVDVL